MRVGELALPLTGCSWCKVGPDLNWEAQTQGVKLAHPNIYPIYELPECVKGLVLQIQSCRISMTQGNNRTSIREESIPARIGIDSVVDVSGLKPDQRTLQ